MQRIRFDPERCLACRSCELACAVAHSQSGSLEGALAEASAPRTRVELALGPRGLEAVRCRDCDDPLCTFACKSGALSRREPGGPLLLDAERCVGCYMCLMVCPDGVRAGAGDEVVRCDLCAGLHREAPACLEACPTHALTLELAAGRGAPRSDFRGSLVVVGSSAAGIAACEAARELAPECAITLVTADEDPTTSRPLLPYLLSGELESEPDLRWRSHEELAELGVTLRTRARASGLDPERRRLLLEGGEAIGYDRLVIATGARGTRLRAPGAELRGVRTIRELDDLRAIRELARPGRGAVVLGGGNVGLQACEALLGLGLRVTVVVRSPHLLSQMVDAEAGRRVGELFAAHGLQLRLGRDAVAIHGAGRVEAVELDDGERLEADLVVVGKGVEPNVEWLEGSGVAIGRGVSVDLSGRTSVAHVYAAGDCAESPDPESGRLSLSGIWPIAYELGRAAGSAAVGVERPAPGALRMNASRFFGTPLISVGEVREDRVEGGVARILERTETSYRKLVFKGGRLAGALLLGAVGGAGLFYRLYRARVEIEESILARIENRNAERVLRAYCAWQV